MQAQSDQKQAKREARALLDEARAVHARGDYRAAREAYAKTQASAGDTDAGRQAGAELAQFTIDRMAIYAGLGFLTLLILAWLVAL